MMTTLGPGRVPIVFQTVSKDDYFTRFILTPSITKQYHPSGVGALLV